MKGFQHFLDNLLKNPSRETTLSIKGAKKKVRAMVKLTSKNFLDYEYIKILLEDGSFLLIIPADEEIYFADKVYGRIKEISDEMIGRERITYKGKEYKLANKDDYQFVKELYVGTPLDIEGECKFSDYFPVSGPKEFLSLGWLSYTGKRADINPVIIDNSEVELLSP